MIKKVKKEIKMLPKKFLVVLMAMAMLISYFSPITKVFANASAKSLDITIRDNSIGHVTVRYSLNDGETWEDVTSNTHLDNIVVTGNNLRLKIDPDANYVIDWTGIEVNGTTVADLAATDAFQSGDGYSVPGNIEDVSLVNVEVKPDEDNPGQPEPPSTTAQITVSVSGEELEYNVPWSDDASDFVFGINNGDMVRLSKDEVNYTTENNEIVGLTTKAAFDYQYDYNNEENVRFTIRSQWDDVYTSLIINDHEYNTPRTKEELTEAFENGGISFEINVPYDDHYDIVVVGRKQNANEKIMGNFGWTYDPNTNEYSDDDKIPHGNFEFVKAVYNNTTYNTPADVNAAGGVFKWKDANKENDPYGEAVFPPGTELTVRLIPDSGYQLTALTLNGTPFEPGEEVGVYTFTIQGGNWHLGAEFTETQNEVDLKAERVDSGAISNVEFEYGTAKLEVDNVSSMSPAREAKFVEAADEYEIDNYLEISLYNTIYKGGQKDENNNYLSWNTEVNNLQDKATIELELNGDIDGDDLVIIHEKHLDNNEVQYEVIDAEFDSENNKVTFETDSFSTYAIATRTTIKDTPYVVKDGDNEISFKEEAGHTYKFELIDYLAFTKEEVMAAARITSEQYDEIFGGVKKQAEEKGTFLFFFDVGVYEEVTPDPSDPDDDGKRYIHEGPFTVKIKLTDELKKYNSFEMYYINEQFKFEGKAIEFKVSEDGKYLVGTLEHLSPYVLVGNIVNNNTSTETPAATETTNPKTGDAIIAFTGLGLISVIGLAFIAKKKKYN